MQTLTDGPLVLILGWFCDSPMTALAYACTSRESTKAMETAWNGLHQVWSKKWGSELLETSQPLAVGNSSSSFSGATSTSSSSGGGGGGRTSKRLRDREYYSARRKFVRLVETGAIHAAHVHAEIFALSCEKRTLTIWKLKDMLHEWKPVWVNCGGFGREQGASSILVEALRSRSVTARHARSIVEELVLNWGADVDAKYGDGMRPLCVAAARGFPAAVEFLLTRNCSVTQKSSGTFMVKKKTIRGTYSAHEWAVMMYNAELASGTRERDLKNLKRCIELTSVKSENLR